MNVPNSAAPPVRVKLYNHQIAAYLFVLRIFGALEEGAMIEGGDADEHFHG